MEELVGMCGLFGVVVEGVLFCVMFMFVFFGRVFFIVCWSDFLFLMLKGVDFVEFLCCCCVCCFCSLVCFLVIFGDRV